MKAALHVLPEQSEELVLLRELGFQAMKIEPMRSNREIIIELTRRAREALGSRGILCVDVGCLWNDVDMALEGTQRLVEFDVFFLLRDVKVESSTTKEARAPAIGCSGRTSHSHHAAWCRALCPHLSRGSQPDNLEAA